MNDVKRRDDPLPAEVEAVAAAAAEALASIARPMAEVVRTFAGAVRRAGRAAVRDDDDIRRSTMAQRKSSGGRKRSSRSRGGRKYGQSSSKNVERAMHKMKRGKLRSGRSGKRVKSRKQAIAIGLSEARAKGAKVPRKRSSSRGSSRKK
jgi:hypothetical protein